MNFQIGIKIIISINKKAKRFHIWLFNIFEQEIIRFYNNLVNNPGKIPIKMLNAIQIMITNW